MDFCHSVAHYLFLDNLFALDILKFRIFILAVSSAYTGVFLLQCTPDYAYGADGFPAWGIQPNSTLAFEIEVLSAQ